MKAIQNIIPSLEVVGQDHCEKHNQTFDLIKTPTGLAGYCPECWEEKIQKEDEQIVIKALEYKRDWQDGYIKRFEHVSSDLLDAKLTTYKPTHPTQEKALKMAVNYVKTFNKKKSLIFSGAPGRGKSHLAYAITKALRRRKYKTLFIKTTDLLDLFRSTYRVGSKLTEDRIFKLIESIDLLVLDDLGSEYVRGNDEGHETWASDILYKVMDLRLNKSLVCTTNYIDTELKKKYGYNGERIISRMMENAQAIRIQGDDNRQKNRF